MDQIALLMNFRSSTALLYDYDGSNRATIGLVAEL